MGQSITMKQNDTSPSYIMEITTPGVSLVGATAVLITRIKGGAVVINRRDLPILKDAWDHNGGPELLLDWQTGDTATVGQFEMEVEVTYADLHVETFPKDDYDTLNVIDDIG